MWSKTTDGKCFMVCGGVARDAEYKQVGDKNSSLTKFSIKSDEQTLEDGTTKALWTNCECWHSVARAAKAIKKGDTVFAVGTIKENTWTDKDTGEPKSAKVLVCDFVIILPFSAPPTYQDSAAAPASGGSFVSASANTNVRVPAPEGGDDYPF